MSNRGVRDHEDTGRAIRSTVPRSRHADWRPADWRPDPVATLRVGEAQRLPELLGLRYERMAASPYGFLRGAASVMAVDLANTVQTGLRVQACGDAHIGNFRLLGTPERALNFDLNDFDETAPAPFEWDLKRLAASAVVAARFNGFAPKQCRSVALSAVRSYRLRMAGFAGMRSLEVWYSRIDRSVLDDVLVESDIDQRQHQLALRAMRKAGEKDNLRASRRLTTWVDGRRMLVEDPPLMVHRAQDDQVVRRVVRSYRRSLPSHVAVLFDRYELVDYALKVVGVGSVGTRCWVALFEGGGSDDPLILQVKQAGRSVLEPFAGRDPRDHGGRRVVEGQRLIQAAGDIFLGWTSGVEGMHYYVRQLWDMKGKLDTQLMSQDSLSLFAELSGWALARAHARSGDPAAIAGYIGSGDAFDNAITGFAVAYADQTERDHQRLCDALDKGELPGPG